MNMTSEQCARCDRHLSDSNTNPDRLCGYCQRVLTDRALREWRKSKERITGKETGGVKVAGRRVRRNPRLPEPAGLPVPYLLACCRELKRRAKDARMVLDAVGEEIK